MTKLAATLNQLDSFVYRYVKEAIAEVGKDYRDMPVKIFRVAAEDHHLRVRSWLITHQQMGNDTTQESIGQNPDMETIGNLRVTFALPGKAVKDDSQKPRYQQEGDNTGVDAFLTQENLRRNEQQTCREVASDFCDRIQRYCNVNGLFIEDYNITDNNPHTESNKLIWHPVTCEIRWKLWWRKGVQVA